ncbi:alpha-amylase family glycosyl hydrolase [uncultured Anaerococcus sp.]|uniref:alpha-amylase family glycosyl hydrolase n=1 Tax=uncultured Anaerococcus sp. TaxID=293428 RepID=UPI0025D3B96B|nr:alpha-amylase family glycosyl hydrolase [uncultured Anaerococcus sp.]
MLENKEIKSTYYEVFPESFLDSNGDGIGDLEGLRSKLTTISQLGPNYVLLNQIFEEKDGQIDYKQVKKVLGDKKDLENVVKKAKEIRMKIIIDFDIKDLLKTYGEKFLPNLEEVLTSLKDLGIRGIRIKNLDFLYKNDKEDLLKEIKSITEEFDLMFIGGFKDPDLAKASPVDLAYLGSANQQIKDKDNLEDFYVYIDKAQKLTEKKPVGLDFDNLNNPRLIEKILAHDREARPLTEALAILLLSLKTIPFIFQGTEIEAKAEYEIDMKNVNDIEIKELYKSYIDEGMDEEAAYNKVRKASNLSAKIPLRWDGSRLGRFSEVENYYGTLIHFDNNYKEYMKHSDSFFHYLYDIIMLRKRESAFALGDYELLSIDEQVYAYKRVHKDKTYVVLINLSDDFYEIKEEITNLIKDGEAIKNNNPDYDPEILDAYQALIIEL